MVLGPGPVVLVATDPEANVVGEVNMVKPVVVVVVVVIGSVAVVLHGSWSSVEEQP